MLQHLSWPELKTRHKISRLQTFYKALHNQIPLSIPSNYLSITRETRQYHQQGWIQELARGGAQTGKVVGGWGVPDSLDYYDYD